MDLTVVAYTTLGLSLLVSAIKVGDWILHADPRAIINSGRWALIALTLLALAVLLWLMASGRWTYAMMLAAFLLPVLVQAAPRWRVLLGPLNVGRGHPDFAASRGGGIVSGNFATMRRQADAAPVQQSIAVSADRHASRGRTSERARRAGARACRPRRRSRSWGSGRPPRRSGKRTAVWSRRSSPQFGGTQYLSTKIDEARDVLLRE